MCGAAIACGSNHEASRCHLRRALRPPRAGRAGRRDKESRRLGTGRESAVSCLASPVFILWERTMDELRKMFPIQIVRGALLRPDGVAVGLVSGGAPAWDLLSRAARGQAGDEYHRLLLSFDAPIDLYVVDQPPDLAGEVATLLSRRDGSDTPILTAVRGAIADYLTELASQGGSRAKQAIWAVTAMSGVGARGVSRLNIPSLIGHHAGGGMAARGSAASPA